MTSFTLSKNLMSHCVAAAIEADHIGTLEMLLNKGAPLEELHLRSAIDVKRHGKTQPNDEIIALIVRNRQRLEGDRETILQNMISFARQEGYVQTATRLSLALVQPSKARRPAGRRIAHPEGLRV